MPRTVSRSASATSPSQRTPNAMKVGIGEAAADDRDVDGELVRCHDGPRR